MWGSSTAMLFMATMLLVSSEQDNEREMVDSNHHKAVTQEWVVPHKKKKVSYKKRLRGPAKKNSDMPTRFSRIWENMNEDII